MKTHFKLSSRRFQELPPVVREYFPDNDFSFSYLLTQNSVKTLKGEKEGYLTGVLYLAPHSVAGKSLCTSSTEECRKACLWSSGQLGMPSGRKATIARTVFLNHYPDKFMGLLLREIAKLERKAKRKGMKTAIRLNGTSDIAWESSKYGEFLQLASDLFPEVVFYDYTKHIGRCVNGYRRKKGLNSYKLTFSYSGQNWAACEKALADGCNVAMCFADELPERYKGFKVINGDKNDLRFLDPKGVIVGLTYKLPKMLDARGTLPVIQVPNFVIQEIAA